MNERIKELIKQVGTDSSGKWIGVENVEKFAELIVAECTKILADNNEFRGCVIISKHFGVELDVNETLRNRNTYFGNDI